MVFLMIKKEVIFERFVKLDSFTQGLGLGLSLCKIIIERMHGTIGVESEVGEGSLSGLLSPIYPTIIFKIYG